MASNSDNLKPSPNPNCFGNFKGMLELIGIYSNDVTVLNANFRKWAIKYHPDKGGEKDFFSLVTECVRGATEYLERHQQASPEGFEEVGFQDLREHNQVRFTNDLGVIVHGVILQLHPPWSPDKTHIVICKTDANWVPEPATKKLYVPKESIHALLKKKLGANDSASAATAAAAAAATTITPTPTNTPTFENVQWRDLRAGDKIRVSYVNVKNPATTLTAYGIFRAAPTYSDVVEFVKTDESFNNLSKSFTSLPLTGSMCRFQRVVAHKMHTQNAPSWAPGSCAAMPSAAANTATKKRKVA
eukprot:Phypoly_transcript_14231.p1 GENE.Phypoly_transcript_14231~~Phypoly_transcript_14231.p1  ORF type:complete len:321 (+),score=69.84 Phypoly_transcript_14231:63-965(+)